MVISQSRPALRAYAASRTRNPPLPTPRLIGWRYHRLQRPWSDSYRSQSPSTRSLPWASRLVKTRARMRAPSLAHLPPIDQRRHRRAVAACPRGSRRLWICLRRQRCVRRRCQCSHTKDRGGVCDPALRSAWGIAPSGGLRLRARWAVALFWRRRRGVGCIHTRCCSGEWGKLGSWGPWEASASSDLDDLCIGRRRSNNAHLFRPYPTRPPTGHHCSHEIRECSNAFEF